jgi:hypothetical protein
MRPHLSRTITRPETAHILPPTNLPGLAGRQSPTLSIVPLDNLWGRGNYKFDHLDKTKDLSANPAGKTEPRAASRGNRGSLRQGSLSAGRAEPSCPDGDLPRIPRLSHTYFPQTISLPARKPPCHAPLEEVPSEANLSRLPRRAAGRAVEGSAVLSTSIVTWSLWKRHSPLCHPEQATCLWQATGKLREE